MPNLLNKRFQAPTENTIYIGRPSVWGNPFIIGQDGTREEVIDKYKTWIMDQPELIKKAKKELKGKDLMCWCSPHPCHGSILLFIANDEDR